MTKPINTAGIEKATGTSWDEWVKVLSDMGAKDLSHKEIALKLYHMLDGKLENHGWWAQGITVAYEQYIGRRAPGQREDGTFEVSVSKTVNGTMNELFAQWCELADTTKFNNLNVESTPNTSKTEKWRNWRVSLEDGTRVVVGINQKDPKKAMLSLAHQKIASAAAAESWRFFWRDFLKNLA